MHKLYELKDKLMKELEEYADNGKFSKDDVEAIKYTASAIDHICNVVEREDEEYSNMYPYAYESGSYAGRSYARGGRGNNRGGGSSYARGRMNARRDSMGRYSREGGYSRAGEDIAEQLREMMPDAPDEHIRMEIERLANKVEKM